MNDTIITNEKLKRLKDLVIFIEENTTEIKYLDNVIFVQQNFKLTTSQGIEKKELKKLNKKYQKEINETIKNL